MSQTDVNAQTVNPKEFNFIAAVLWFQLFGIGLPIYVNFRAGHHGSLRFASASCAFITYSAVRSLSRNVRPAGTGMTSS